ncbi:MAG TPA: Trp biosynthesis-associated membrane protein [Micromonosporaceae bacterium]
MSGTGPASVDQRVGGRRELTYTVLGCLVGAGLALLSASRTWSVEVTARPAPLPPLRQPHTGAALAAWLPALALVALAGAGALLATRRSGRVAVGILLVLCGLGIAAGGGYGLAEVPGASAGWPVVALLGGVLVVAAGLVATAHGRRWPSMGGRYERDAGSGSTGRGGGERDAWDALDRGEDPTR